MRHLVYAAALLLALTAASCRNRKDESEMIPPGFCKTEAECLPVADRQNAYQNDLRQKLADQGVHDQYLPCGPYKVTQAPNGFWQVTRDTTGCPATASQQDPYPDPSKAKHHKQ